MPPTPSGARRPTLKDVAAAAGVSPMTVSYVFSQPGRVAEHTLDHVLATARRLGYHRPDGTARALRSGRTGQIGVVLGEHLSYAFDDPQATLFLAGIADVCVEDNLGMVLIPTHGDASDVDRVLGAVVDAYVLWTRADDDPVLRAVTDRGRPAAIQGGPATAGIVCVGPDDEAAAAAVAAVALARGEDVVIVSFPLDEQRAPAFTHAAELPARIPFPVTRSRLKGFRAAIQAAGIEWDTVPVVVVDRNTRAAGQAAAAVAGLADMPPTTVVLTMSDELALGVIDGLSGTGREFTVTGWDGSREAMESGIISVSNPLREQGRLCARVALDPTTPVDDVPWRIVLPL